MHDEQSGGKNGKLCIQIKWSPFIQKVVRIGYSVQSMHNAHIYIQVQWIKDKVIHNALTMIENEKSCIQKNLLNRKL